MKPRIHTVGAVPATLPRGTLPACHVALCTAVARMAVASGLVHPETRLAHGVAQAVVPRLARLRPAATPARLIRLAL